MPYRRAVRKTIGRRGLLLILSGGAWTLIGVQILQTPTARFVGGVDATSNVLSFMDHTGWGWMWVVCGILAVVMGFWRNRSPFYGRDDIGFNLILTPVLIWTLFFAFSWIAHLTTGGEFGRANSSYGLVAWGLITGFIMVVAGWPEDIVLTPEEEREAHVRHRERRERRRQEL